MPPNHFESEVESFLEVSHGDRTHIKRADHHTVTPLCGTLLKRTYICGALVTCLCIAELFTVVCGRAAVVSVPLRVGRVVPQTHVQLNSNPERSCTVAVRLSSFSPYWTLRN